MLQRCNKMLYRLWLDKSARWTIMHLVWNYCPGASMDLQVRSCMQECCNGYLLSAGVVLCDTIR